MRFLWLALNLMLLHPFSVLAMEDWRPSSPPSEIASPLSEIENAESSLLTSEGLPQSISIVQLGLGLVLVVDKYKKNVWVAERTEKHLIFKQSHLILRKNEVIKWIKIHQSDSKTHAFGQESAVLETNDSRIFTLERDSQGLYTWRNILRHAEKTDSIGAGFVQGGLARVNKQGELTIFTIMNNVHRGPSICTFFESTVNENSNMENLTFNYAAMGQSHVVLWSRSRKLVAFRLVNGNDHFFMMDLSNFPHVDSNVEIHVGDTHTILAFENGTWLVIPHSEIAENSNRGNFEYLPIEHSDWPFQVFRCFIAIRGPESSSEENKDEDEKELLSSSPDQPHTYAEMPDVTEVPNDQGDDWTVIRHPYAEMPDVPTVSDPRYGVILSNWNVGHDLYAEIPINLVLMPYEEGGTNFQNDAQNAEISAVDEGVVIYQAIDVESQHTYTESFATRPNTGEGGNQGERPRLLDVVNLRGGFILVINDGTVLVLNNNDFESSTARSSHRNRAVLNIRDRIGDGGKIIAVAVRHSDKGEIEILFVTSSNKFFLFKFCDQAGIGKWNTVYTYSSTSAYKRPNRTKTAAIKLPDEEDVVALTAHWIGDMQGQQVRSRRPIATLKQKFLRLILHK